MTQEITYHAIGPQEYKVDHVEKKVYKKQVLDKHIPPMEKSLHPEGFKWLDTNGDYQQFVSKFGIERSPAPIILDVLAEAQKKTPKSAVQDSVVESAPVVLPVSITSSRKLSKVSKGR